MTDENTGAPAPAPVPSPEATVPKKRLDEELAKKRQLEEQVKFQQQMLQQQMQSNQQQAPQAPQVNQAEQQRLRKLREDNPDAYRAEMQNRKLRAEMDTQKQFLAEVAENQDRQELLNKYGKGAEKRLNDVEAALNQFRANGQYGYKREHVYMWMLGQEKLQADQQAAQAAAPVAPPVPAADPAPAPAAPAPEAFDAPPSDPNLATNIQGGKAASGAPAKSFEEAEKDLENLEF